jgi:hypothetical protein
MFLFERQQAKPALRPQNSPTDIALTLTRQCRNVCHLLPGTP